MAQQTVDQIISTQQAAIDATLRQADGYLQQLIQQSNAILIDTSSIILPAVYDYTSVPAVGFPVFTDQRPVITAAVNPLPSTPDFSFFSLRDIPMPVDDLLAPTAVFTFAEQAYASTLLDPLKAKLLADLQNGGYGIDPTDEIALLNRARDREVELAMTRIDDAGRVMAARGFPLPPGEFAIAVDRAYQELQSKVSAVNREITLDRAKRFVDARQFTFREVKELEGTLINFWNSIQERSLNASKAAVEMSIAIYNTLLARYRLRLEAAKFSADVQFQVSAASIEQTKAKFEAFRAQIAAFEAALRAAIEPARLKVDVFRANIDESRMINDALIAQVGLQQKVIEATKQQNIEISKMNIENARVRMTGAVEQIRFRAETAKYASEKFFALLSSLEGTINTLAVQTVAQ